MKAFLSTTLVFASLVLSVAAEARTIYWTGYGSTPQQAVNDGAVGVRNDCVTTKGYHPYTCSTAPISQVEHLGLVSQLIGYDYYGNPIYSTQYAARVYLLLP